MLGPLWQLRIVWDRTIEVGYLFLEFLIDFLRQYLIIAPGLRPLLAFRARPRSNACLCLAWAPAHLGLDITDQEGGNEYVRC